MRIEHVCVCVCVCVCAFSGGCVCLYLYFLSLCRLNKQVYVAQTVYKPGVHPFAHAGRLDCLGS